MIKLSVISMSFRPFRRWESTFNTIEELERTVAKLEKMHDHLEATRSAVVVKLPSGVSHILGRY